MDPAETTELTEPADPVSEPDVEPVDESPAPAPEVAQADAAETQAVSVPVDENVEAGPETSSAPRDVPLPFPAPPYDYASALHRIALQNREVTAAREDWERAKEDASSCRKTYEREAEKLEKLIAELETQEKDADRQQAAPLVGYIAEGAAARAENPEAKKPGCLYERETGAPCPICRDRKPGDEGRDEPANPLHPMHGEAARGQAIAEALQAKLREAGVFLDLDEIAAVITSQEDADAIAAWAGAIVARSSGSSAPSPARPDCLGQPHEAAEPGDERQSCRVCGTLLRDSSDNQLDGGTWYPAGALVGTDCEGEPEAEEARPVKKRGSKKGRKKHDPEAVAAEQVAAGAAVSEESAGEATV